MKTDRMAVLALGCVGTFAIAAPALGAKGDTVKTGTYKGSKLQLKVAKKSMTPSEVDQPVVKGDCLITNTQERSTSSFSITPKLKFKGKRPKVGVKYVRTLHITGKNPVGLPVTTDWKLTVKFSKAKKAKVTVEYKYKSVGTKGSTLCAGKGSDTVRRK